MTRHLKRVLTLNKAEVLSLRHQVARNSLRFDKCPLSYVSYGKVAHWTPLC